MTGKGDPDKSGRLFQTPGAPPRPAEGRPPPSTGVPSAPGGATRLGRKQQHERDEEAGESDRELRGDAESWEHGADEEIGEPRDEGEDAREAPGDGDRVRAER